MKDTCEIAGWIFELLHVILITGRIHHLRIPLHRVDIIIPHYPMLGELVELRDIAHRPAIVAWYALELHLTWRPNNEITPVHPDSRDSPLDLLIGVVVHLELVFAVEIV